MGAPDERRLDDIESQIDDARETAEEDGLLPEDDSKQTFADPDGDGEIEPPNVVGVWGASAPQDTYGGRA